MISIVGIGPGHENLLTRKAYETLKKTDVIVGYKTYVQLIRQEFPDKEYRDFPMKSEVLRCEDAYDLALQGKHVCVISSGDPGIYGMAGILMQVLEKNNSTMPIEVIPGVTAASAAASLLGAPLMHDAAFISLSDLLTPLDQIKKRIHYAAKADFVICLYNPKSKTRRDYVQLAADLILPFRDENTPVGIVSNAYREGQSVTITTLKQLPHETVHMATTVIVGNSTTYVSGGKMITPRGYGL